LVLSYKRAGQVNEIRPSAGPTAPAISDTATWNEAIKECQSNVAFEFEYDDRRSRRGHSMIAGGGERAQADDFPNKPVHILVPYAPAAQGKSTCCRARSASLAISGPQPCSTNRAPRRGVHRIAALHSDHSGAGWRHLESWSDGHPSISSLPIFVPYARSRVQPHRDPGDRLLPTPIRRLEDQPLCQSSATCRRGAEGAGSRCLRSFGTTLGRILSPANS